MKKTFKILGIIAVVALVGFSMAACDLDPPALSWTQGTLANSAARGTHTIAVTSGTTYYVWIKDYWTNSVPASETDWASVMHAGKYDDDTVAYAESGSGSNATTTATFTATKTGDVTITTRCFSGGGRYKIAVTTVNRRPSGD